MLKDILEFIYSKWGRFILGALDLGHHNRFVWPVGIFSLCLVGLPIVSLDTAEAGSGTAAPIHVILVIAQATGTVALTILVISLTVAAIRSSVGTQVNPAKRPIGEVARQADIDAIAAIEKELLDQLRLILKRARAGIASSADIETALSILKRYCDHEFAHLGATFWVKLAVWNPHSSQFDVEYSSLGVPDVEQDYRVPLGKGGIGDYAAHVRRQMSEKDVKSPSPKGYSREELIRLAPEGYAESFDHTPLRSEVCFPIFATEPTSGGKRRIACYPNEADGARVYLRAIGVICSDAQDYRDWYDNNMRAEKVRRFAGFIGRIIGIMRPGKTSMAIDVPKGIWHTQLSKNRQGDTYDRG